VSGPILPPQPDPAHGMAIPSRLPDGSAGPDLYFMGIIDILQQYDLRKRGENLLRRIVQPAAGISAVDPAFYGDRFVQFLADHTR
jgi:1-phosphatidylinositol-4-phosphate 5-kinase